METERAESTGPPETERAQSTGAPETERAQSTGAPETERAPSTGAPETERAQSTGATGAPPAKRYRIVVAKVGLDGHDRGAKVISRALRDGGFEVIYTGLRQTPEQVAETALQEDADAVGLSILSGAHMTLFPRVMEELRTRGLDDVLVFGGGIVPQPDIDALKAQGVAEIFTPGSTMASITEWLRAALDARETAA